MDPESKKLLEETHDMVKKMRNSQKNARMWKGIYWVVIIGVTYAGYLYIRPYLEKTMALYDAAQQQVDSLKNFTK